MIFDAYFAQMLSQGLPSQRGCAARGRRQVWDAAAGPAWGPAVPREWRPGKASRTPSAACTAHSIQRRSPSSQHRRSSAPPRKLRRENLSLQADFSFPQKANSKRVFNAPKSNAESPSRPVRFKTTCPSQTKASARSPRPPASSGSHVPSGFSLSRSARPSSSSRTRQPGGSCAWSSSASITLAAVSVGRAQSGARSQPTGTEGRSGTAKI